MHPAVREGRNQQEIGEDPPPTPPFREGSGYISRVKQTICCYPSIMRKSASYKTSSPDRYALLRSYARKNRKNATMAEQYLWEHLRNGALGVDFLRQHIVGDYIADFASRHGGLIVEVDGGYHTERQQVEDDANRESILQQMGFHVLRFTNEEVINNIESVLQQIEDYLNE